MGNPAQEPRVCRGAMIPESMRSISVCDVLHPHTAETLKIANSSQSAGAQSVEHGDVIMKMAGAEFFSGAAAPGVAWHSGGNLNPPRFIGSNALSVTDVEARWDTDERSRAGHDESRAGSNARNACLLVELGDDQFFLAASDAMRAIHAKICTIAPFDVPVLITGESGVGKEVVANLLHRRSARATRQFLKINCAALPNDLLESELFGYEAGAFTGALKSKPGRFEQCAKGTILLDEIGEMSPMLQAKLLHVLQDGEFSRLGARINTKVDVRMVAATNVDIEKAIAEHKFREDLYYRLNAFVIHIPPVRERREEIPYFLLELSKRLSKVHHMAPIDFSPRLLAAAVEFSWPGNLREMVNFVKRHLILRDDKLALDELESKMLTGRSHSSPSLNMPPAMFRGNMKAVVRSLKDQAELRMIVDTLDETHWNRRIAAERLQISYRALLYKIKQYSLAVSD